MDIKRKLVSAFIGLAVLALGIGAAALFDAHVITAKKHALRELRLISSITDIRDLQPQQLPDGYLIIKQAHADAKSAISDNMAPVWNQFAGEKLPETDQIEIDGVSYVWSADSHAEDGGRTIVLAPIDQQSVGSFFSAYGAEFVVFTIFVIWSALWVGLVVSSLINKINNQKQLLEEQHEKAINETKAKSQFLAHISHEIRTPLSAIIGYSETLLHSDQPMKERLSSINTIIRNGNHMLNLVNDLLDLSKIEANKLELESLDVDLIPLLQDIEHIFLHQSKTKGIDFKVKYHFPIATTIATDPIRLKQILINLCSNAVKFTKSGYVYLDVKQKDDRHIQFMVEDSGVGMTSEQLTQIFKAYAQADSSTTRKFGGTGLGLSLSKHLANMLGGDIEVSSRAGRGSTFTLTVECADLTQREVVNDLSEYIAPLSQSSTSFVHDNLTGKVLIAEDNQDNQALFTMYMKRFGITPDIAHNGQEAIEQVLSHDGDYDLIFMDMQMPIMDGIEATRNLRQKSIAAPIVALTANAMKDDMNRFYAAGCNDFITKPVKRDQLFEVCSKYLQIRTQDAELKPLHSTVLDEDPDFIDIISKFSNRLPGIIEKLHMLNNSGDFEDLARETHDLKGVSGNMGYMEISEMAGKLEFQIAIQDKQEIAFLIDKLDHLRQRLQLGLEAISA